MKRKKKIFISVAAGVVLLVMLILFASSALAAVSVGTRNTTHTGALYCRHISRAGGLLFTTQK